MMTDGPARMDDMDESLRRIADALEGIQEQYERYFQWEMDGRPVSSSVDRYGRPLPFRSGDAPLPPLKIHEPR